MGLTNYPNGITSFGIPQIGGSEIPTTTGDVYFVHSGTGNNGFEGTTEQPLATIDAAINKCTADQGDIIIVKPGHTENISAATSLVVDVAGISIIGLGLGRNRPVLVYTATAGRIPISANNVLIRNLVLESGIADVVSGMTVTGDDVTLDGLEFNGQAANKEFLQMLDIDTALRPRVINCKFLASETAGTNTGVRVDDTDHLEIRNCEFRGDYTVAAISGTTGSGTLSTDAAVIGNLIENRDTTAGVLLDHHDSTTGITADNRGFTLYATDIVAPFDTGATLCGENYVVNAVDETAALSPGTPSA